MLATIPILNTTTPGSHWAAGSLGERRERTTPGHRGRQMLQEETGSGCGPARSEQWGRVQSRLRYGRPNKCLLVCNGVLACEWHPRGVIVSTSPPSWCRSSSSNSSRAMWQRRTREKPSNSRWHRDFPDQIPRGADQQHLGEDQHRRHQQRHSQVYRRFRTVQDEGRETRNSQTSTCHSQTKIQQQEEGEESHNSSQLSK